MEYRYGCLATANHVIMCEVPYHVDVTCCPWGVVLIAEQTYWLPSGSTSTGLMLSLVHPSFIVSDRRTRPADNGSTHLGRP
jgi:hypothetical protein